MRRQVKRLRELLDMAGIGWRRDSPHGASTRFRADGIECMAYPTDDGGIGIQAEFGTPEEALKAIEGMGFLECYELEDGSITVLEFAGKRYVREDA